MKQSVTSIVLGNILNNMLNKIIINNTNINWLMRLSYLSPVALVETDISYF